MNKKENFVITINRELGTGGRTVGRKLSEKLGVNYYDKAILQGLTKKFGLSAEKIERIKADRKSWWQEMQDTYRSLLRSNDVAEPSVAEIFEAERQILENIAAEGSCVVAGRTAFLIFREWKNRLNIFIQATTEHRIERLMGKGRSFQDAFDTIGMVDEDREAYLKKYGDRSRYDTRNYDLVINMDGLTEDDAVEIILDYVNRSSK